MVVFFCEWSITVTLGFSDPLRFMLKRLTSSSGTLFPAGHLRLQMLENRGAQHFWVLSGCVVIASQGRGRHWCCHCCSLVCTLKSKFGKMVTVSSWLFPLLLLLLLLLLFLLLLHCPYPYLSCLHLLLKDKLKGEIKIKQKMNVNVSHAVNSTNKCSTSAPWLSRTKIAA